MSRQKQNSVFAGGLISKHLWMALLAFTLITGACSNPSSADSAAENQVDESNIVEEQNTEADVCGDEGASACLPETGESMTSSFIPTEFDEAIAAFTQGKDGLYYFGFESCPWCKEMVPILKEEAEKLSIPVHYVMTRNANHDRLYSDEQKEQIQPYIEDFMSENDEGVMTLYVPLIVSVKDGEVVAGHEGTVEGHKAPERKMTEAEKQQATDAVIEVLETQLAD